MSDKEIQTIDSPEQFDQLIHSEEAMLVYFSHEDCFVCKVLKPKVRAMLEMEYPKMKMYYADTVNTPEIAGQQRVFTVPTILVFINRKEYIRVSRNIGVRVLSEQIRRPYEMMFE